MQSLYFIALLPHRQLRDEITAFKNHMAAAYFSKAALTSPPHITLYPPFRIDVQNEISIVNSLITFAAKRQGFQITLNGFACFKPSVIFIKPEYNEQLNLIRSQLLVHLRSTAGLHDVQNDRPYHPHMTIATRDLKKSLFQVAWEEFKSKKFNATFDVNCIFLLKHNGKHWDIFGEYPLGRE